MAHGPLVKTSYLSPVLSTILTNHSIPAFLQIEIEACGSRFYTSPSVSITGKQCLCSSDSLSIVIVIAN